MPNLFEKFLNQVGGAYRQADKNLGGWLPGGGTANPLSKTISSINPQDALGYVITTTAKPAENKIVKELRNVIDSGNWATTVKQVPGLMSAATERMNQLGVPGVWSTDLPNSTPKNLGQGELPKGVRVDTTGSYGMFPFMGPHYEYQNQVVSVGPKTPSWVIAHELGHAVDVAKRPGSFAMGMIDKNPELFESAMKNAPVRILSPGALVVGAGTLKDSNQDQSLLSAGIQGALTGIGANQHMLNAEIQADRYGMQLAKQAGVPWNHPQNMWAKGSYLAASMYPGFAQGIVAELGNRAVNTIGDLFGTTVRALQGPGLSKTEQALTKYGYNPTEYKLEGSNGEVQLNKRNKAEQALYQFITNPNKQIQGGY